MRDPSPPTPQPDYLDHAAARRIIVGVLLTMLLAALDQVMVATALPTIAASLGDVENMSWVVTANLLCATAVTPLYGKLSDIHGRRAMMLIAICVYAAGSLASAYPNEKLFKPLGMSSATMETDEDGTLVGSSYMYATARDWARYGLFLLQDGVWQGQEMLPRGYVAMMTSPVAASRGEYGHGLVWRWGTTATWSTPPSCATRCWSRACSSPPPRTPR